MGAERPLPVALAKASKAAHSARMKRLAEQGYEAIARVREGQANVAANMYDIGLALAALKADGVAEALGRAGFGDIVTRDLKMALTTASALVALAARVPRDVVMAIGPGRAAALIELADATPAGDAPADLLNAKLQLPSGRTLNVPKATDHEIREGAKEFRDARPAAKTRRGRGFTTSPEEKAAYAGFDKSFRADAERLDLRTKLVATRDGKGPRVHIEVRFADLKRLADALRKAVAR